MCSSADRNQGALYYMQEWPIGVEAAVSMLHSVGWLTAAMRTRHSVSLKYCDSVA